MYVLSKNRYLVFCRASDQSLHNEWINDKANKNFDLFIEYYGIEDKKYMEECDYYSHYPAKTKFPRLFELIQKGDVNFFDYDAIWFGEDDIQTTTNNINSMFKIFTDHNLWLAQPALTKESFIAHSITQERPGSILRYTNFVEVMVPIFSPFALEKCLETFSKSASGWGLDFVWPKILGYPTDKIAIIDAAPVTHTREGWKGDLYKFLPINPRDELNKLLNEYDARGWRFVEYRKN